MLDPLVGWSLVIIGIVLVIIEILLPGQTFLVIAGAFFLTLGGIGLATGDEGVTFGPVGLGSSLAVTVVVAVGTIYAYSRLSPVAKPTTTAAESLIGQTGIVTKKIVPNSMVGKVEVGSMEWSAKAEEEVDVGKHVEVVDSKGVHVIVVEIEPPRKKGGGGGGGRRKRERGFELDEDDLEEI